MYLLCIPYFPHPESSWRILQSLIKESRISLKNSQKNLKNLQDFSSWANLGRGNRQLTLFLFKFVKKSCKRFFAILLPHTKICLKSLHKNVPVNCMVTTHAVRHCHPETFTTWVVCRGWQIVTGVMSPFLEFDQRVKDHKDKALEAMKQIPVIEELLQQAENETEQAYDAINGAEQTASEAVDIAQRAQAMADEASKVTSSSFKFLCYLWKWKYPANMTNWRKSLLINTAKFSVRVVTASNPLGVILSLRVEVTESLRLSCDFILDTPMFRSDRHTFSHGLLSSCLFLVDTKYFTSNRTAYSYSWPLFKIGSCPLLEGQNSYKLACTSIL